MIPHIHVAHHIGPVLNFLSQPENMPLQALGDTMPLVEEQSISSDEEQHAGWAKLQRYDLAVILSFLSDREIPEVTSLNRQTKVRCFHDRDLLLQCGKLNAIAKKIVTMGGFLHLLEDASALPPMLRFTLLKTLISRILYLPRMSRQGAAIEIVVASPELPARLHGALLSLLSEEIMYVVPEGRPKVFHVILEAISELPHHIQAGALRKMLWSFFPLPVEARESAFYELLGAIAKLSHNDGIDMPHANSSVTYDTESGVFQDCAHFVFGMSLRLPAHSHLAPLWRLIDAIADLPIASRPKAFINLLKPVADLPLDRRAYSFMYMSHFMLYLPYECQFDAIGELLDAVFALPPEWQVPTLETVGKQFAYFSPGWLQDVFEKCLAALENLSEGPRQTLLEILLLNISLLPFYAIDGLCGALKAATALLPQEMRSSFIAEIDRARGAMDGEFPG
jgi:hypothetical protein